jgi:hypothetical protein
MDEQHLEAAAQHIELNPVRAGLVKKPEDYKWSSAMAHLHGKDVILFKVGIKSGDTILNYPKRIIKYGVPGIHCILTMD